MKKFNDFHREMHLGIVMIRDHMDRYGSAVQSLPARPELIDRDGHLQYIHLRVRGWIKSAAKLDHPSDLQALACCCRSLLESTVDIILLASTTSNSEGDKMRWWDLSAKFQMAIAFVQLNTEMKTKKGSPDVEAASNFIQLNQALVEGTRRRLWPTSTDRNGKSLHPKRWTGSSDIRPDIDLADRSPFRSLIQDNMGSSLFKYYVSEYQKLNKTIHGSGLLGVQGSARLISLRAGFCCYAIASLAMISHQILFKDRTLNKSLEVLEAEWLHINKVRKTSFIYHLKEIEDEDI